MTKQANALTVPTLKSKHILLTLSALLNNLNSLHARIRSNHPCSDIDLLLKGVPGYLTNHFLRNIIPVAKETVWESITSIYGAVPLIDQ